MSPVQEPGWLSALRRRGAAEVARLGLPDRSHEDWKHLDARDLLPATTAAPGHELSALAGEFALPEAWAVAVFAGGVFHPELSRLPEPSRGWSVEPLSSAIDARGADVLAHLGAAVPADHALANLNLERWSDGLLVRVAAGVELPGTVQILEIGSGSSWLHHLFLAGEGSRASLLETHVSPEGVPVASQTLSEAFLGPRASLSHLRVQRSARDARAWNALSARLLDGARLETRHAGVGPALSRAELHVDLAAPGAALSLAGLVALSGEDAADALASVRHLAPGCVSEQLWKAVAGGSSRSNFVGAIHVAPGADGTEARQQSRNIVLSRQAAVHSRPQLEIWADDVKCSHGSATGRLDDKALFFLRSRGLSESDARRVLVEAFAEEIVGAIPWESARADVETLVRERLA